jgi:hypothetical protein
LENKKKLQGSSYNNGDWEEKHTEDLILNADVVMKVQDSEKLHCKETG